MSFSRIVLYIKEHLLSRLFLIALFSLGFFATIWQGFIDYDSSAFSTIGLHVLRGKLLYAEVWDAKPPGVYYLDALSLGLFGVSQKSIWILQYISGIIQILLVYKIVKRFISEEVIRVLAVILYMMLLYFNPAYHGGNFTEEYANTFMLAGIVISVRYTDTLDNWSLMLAGLMFSLTTFFKEPYVFSLLPWVGLLFFWPNPKLGFGKKVISLLSAMALPFIIWGVFILMTGTYLDYWKHLIYNMEYSNYNVQPFMDRLYNAIVRITTLYGKGSGWVAVLPIFFVSAIAFNKGKARVVGFVILLEFLLSWYSIALSGFQFQHYYLQCLPSLFFAIILSIHAVRVQRKLLTNPLRVQSAQLGVLVLLLVACRQPFLNMPTALSNTGVTYKAHHDKLAVKQYINAHRNTNTRIFVEDIAHTDIYLATDCISEQTIPVNFFTFFTVNDTYSDERIAEYIKSFKVSPPNYIIQSEDQGMLTMNEELNIWFRLNYEEVAELDLKELKFWKRLEVREKSSSQ